MKRNVIYTGLLAFGVGIWTLNAGFSSAKKSEDPIQFSLDDLSLFNSPSKSWQIVGNVNSDLTKEQTLFPAKGTGVLLNQPSKKVPGEDLFTNIEFGDIDLELDYLMPRKGNSGVYLQGRYEVQLADSWDATIINSGTNGGIYDLTPPRKNVSKAPGLWQKLKLSFQAPRFDGNGHKVENARLLRVELNGVLIQENVELFKPTPGAIRDDEVAKAPLRIQGDHGAVAFRNIKVSERNKATGTNSGGNLTDPILVDAPVNTILRSFIDLDNKIKVVHAVSVGSPQNVHYSYDLDHGMLVQVWRGKFLDATPMWDGRGNGTSIPQGAVQRFGKPNPTIAKLANSEAAWPVDTTNTQFKQKGYTVSKDDIPTFKYMIYGINVSDSTTILEDGKGIYRSIKLENQSTQNKLYYRLAKAKQIEEVSKGNYLVGDKEYYIQLSNLKSNKPMIRMNGEEKELVILISGELQYSILF